MSLLGRFLLIACAPPLPPPRHANTDSLGFALADFVAFDEPPAWPEHRDVRVAPYLEPPLPLHYGRLRHQYDVQPRPDPTHHHRRRR